MEASESRTIAILAEKPSVAQDIARVLGADKRGKGYLQGNGYVVTWAIGHLVSLAQPHEINPEWRQWRFDQLPILPIEWPLVVYEKTKDQFEVVRKILTSGRVSRIVCATDAGREGELIFRYIYEAAGCRKPVSRLWISSLTPDAIRKGFDKLRPGSEYDRLADAASGRSRADWLVGMNLSRAYSIVYNEELSVGRVQTPTLAMIVDREIAVRSFVPEDYIEVVATFQGREDSKKESYPGTWFRPEAKPGDDNDAPANASRLPADGEEADRIVLRGRTGEAAIESLSSETKRMQPPLLYDLTELQRHANRLFGFSAQQALDLAQALYERHKLISYPRTDSRHLSADVAATVPGTVAAISTSYKLQLASGTGARPLSKRYVDDSKVSDHHAIIPTAVSPEKAHLTEDEHKIYDLICRRFLMMWHGDYHMRQKALVVCPASLRPMWERELAEATISATILSQEELGRDSFNPSAFADVDVVLVDESHNFRNRNANRFASLERVLGANAGRGRDGMRKKVILLTATPVSNDLFDLYNQFTLVTQGDRSYFAAAGIGDLYRYFLQARREARHDMPGVALFNLLEEVVIRRTRSFIRKAYPEATIAGKKVHFPQRELRTVRYNLEETYNGIYEFIVGAVDSLNLAPYNLEGFKKKDVEVDDFEAGREQALVGIFKSRYLKRFESSVEAFRISIRRALAFLQTFESYMLGGKLLKSSDFHKALRYLEREDLEDDAVPSSLADELDANEDAKRVLESMETVDPTLYDLRHLHKAVQHDVKVLTDVWEKVKRIDPKHDTKLQRLKKLLTGDLKGRKILVFTYYRDTARYLYGQLGDPDGADAKKFRAQAGDITVRRMDSGSQADERLRIVQAFAPAANGKPELVGSDREIDLLISTDVLSEGQNLQDCGYLLNYDLHWNPTRMVQRAGRIDRIGTGFDVLWIYNMFPDRGLERLLNLVNSLSQKIADIDRLGMLDASVLGEEVHPRTFNTLKRIEDEDKTVVEEEEQFTELASSEVLVQQLRAYLDGGGREVVESIPDGIHSGLQKPGARGIFFYFRTKGDSQTQHFWKYYDIKTNSILDNRHVLANLISCAYDTPRIVDLEIYQSVFDLQERVLEELLRGQIEKVALQSAPQAIDPLQQTVATIIQSHLNHPTIDRKRGIAAIAFLNGPMQNVQIAELRKLYKLHQRTSSVPELIAGIEAMRSAFGAQPKTGPEKGPASLPALTRENLHLICFDVLTGA